MSVGAVSLCKEADDGKHAFSVIGVDNSLLEANGREVWREGGAVLLYEVGGFKGSVSYLCFKSAHWASLRDSWSPLGLPWRLSEPFLTLEPPNEPFWVSWGLL